MPFFLEIKEEEREDILIAAKWYEKKRSGLHQTFITSVENTLST